MIVVSQAEELAEGRVGSEEFTAHIESVGTDWRLVQTSVVAWTSHSSHLSTPLHVSHHSTQHTNMSEPKLTKFALGWYI